MSDLLLALEPESGDVTNYFLDLSKITFVDEVGELWVANESLVDVEVYSSDPDVATVQPTNKVTGSIIALNHGVAVIEAHISYKGKIIAIATEALVVGIDGVQVVSMELRSPEKAHTNE